VKISGHFAFNTEATKVRFFLKRIVQKGDYVRRIDHCILMEK